MSRAYSYIAIGDSLTVGTGSSRMSGGFVQEYVSLANNWLKRSIRVSMLAHPGLTSRQIYQLAIERKHQQQVFDADVITITAGGNDFIQAFKEMERTGSFEPVIKAGEDASNGLHALVTYICEVKQPCKKPYIIRVFNTYIPVEGVPIVDHYLSQFNRRLYRLERRRNVRVVDVYNAFKGKNQWYLSHDHVHPNDRGYAVMAREAAQTGFEPL
ncbi:GDSL-type esterase/lipase family protein [Shouchella patagoniensis]|uniref:GDSL-type esterase/lipase family protein n=1 Tax=Shouchella patagoniensis TaxID=228576 RepID=UPI001474500E|nr:GDSL-type esterase/lipase family protein [Shouchella patagoniensis]